MSDFAKDTNVPTNDCISRQVAIDELNKLDVSDGVGISSIACQFQESAISAIHHLPSAQTETCDGCKHKGKWENEVENGYNSPCTICKRRVNDNYEK